jgi:hypothetical protein
MVTATRSQETREQALHRLADKARQEGVKLYQDPVDGRYYASSVSQPGHKHYVTGYSCDCVGFAKHGRCKHHAALLSALGWIDSRPNAPKRLPQPKSAPVKAEPDPTAPAPLEIRCSDCNGTGEIQYTQGTGPRTFRYAWQTCRSCRGTGRMVIAA